MQFEEWWRLDGEYMPDKRENRRKMDALSAFNAGMERAAEIAESMTDHECVSDDASMFIACAIRNAAIAKAKGEE